MLLLAHYNTSKIKIIKKGVEKKMFNKKLIQTLKNTINSLEADLDEKKAVIKDYQEENEILLNNAAELRAKIVDLENNIEFLYNNLTPKKKELVRPSNQN